MPAEVSWCTLSTSVGLESDPTCHQRNRGRYSSKFTSLSSTCTSCCFVKSVKGEVAAALRPRAMMSVVMPTCRYIAGVTQVCCGYKPAVIRPISCTF